MINQARASRHLHQLDGLRGIAAIVVVVSHCANAGLLPSVLGRGFGQMGVTLFYALSAFLLGHLYLRTDFSATAIRRYAVSRASRVLPLFYTVLAITFVTFLVFGNTFYDIGTMPDFILNAALIQGTSVLWSIPVELQYYLVFTLLWWLHARFLIGMSRLLVLGLVVQATAAFILWQSSSPLETYNLAFWGHIFLCGLALSQVSPVKGAGQAVPLQALILIAICVLALPEVRRSLGIPTLPNFADPLTAGVPILILFLALRNAPVLRFLKTKVLCFLGNISFALYLVHMPIIDIVKKAGLHTEVPGGDFLLVLLVSIILSWCARHIIEIPSQTVMKAYLNPARAKPNSENQSAS